MNSSRAASIITVLLMAGIVFLGIRAKIRKNDIRLLFASTMPDLLTSAETARGRGTVTFDTSFFNLSSAGREESVSGTDLKKLGQDNAVKIVVVDKMNSCLDNVFFKLPRHLRALAPEEVTSLVTTERIQEKVGYYTHAGSDFQVPAVQHFCEIKIVNIRTGELLESYTLSGRKPPSSTQNTSSFNRTVKDKEVARHIKRFFRQ